MNLFDLSLQFNGFPIKKAKRVLKQIQEKNSSTFENYIEKQKRSIINYHITNNLFYRKFVTGYDTTQWSRVPIMTKHQLQCPLKNRLSSGFTEKNVYLNKTSGSTGNPFIFAKDKFCHALSWAQIEDNYSGYCINNSSKEARFYGIPLDKKGYYKERFKDFLSCRFRFSVFDLSPDSLEKSITKFKSGGFDYINGYTNAVLAFAKYLYSTQRILKTICPTLKVCIVTAEMLFEDDRILMENAFGVPIINEYGASELGIIAFEDKQHNMIINTEMLYVEIVDEHNTVVSHGEEGRIVITSFYNKAHPFIRYDIGDRGIITKTSTLKKAVLKSLLGRSDDVITLPSGKKAAGLTFYYVTKSIIEDGGLVSDFVVEQTKINTFVIKYVSTNKLSSQKKEIIADKIEQYLESGLHVMFERHDTLSRSKSGKLKQFKSLL